MDQTVLLSYRKTGDTFPKSCLKSSSSKRPTADHVAQHIALGDLKDAAAKSLRSSSLPVAGGGGFKEHFDSARHHHQMLSSSLSTTYASSTSSAASTSSEEELTTARRYSDSAQSSSSMAPDDNSSACSSAGSDSFGGSDGGACEHNCTITPGAGDCDELPNDAQSSPATAAMMEANSNAAFVVDEEDLCNNNAVPNHTLLRSGPKSHKTKDPATISVSEIETKPLPDTKRPSTSATNNCFVSFYVNGRRCSVMLSPESLVYEPELTSAKSQSERVVLPLDTILAVRTCQCPTGRANSLKPDLCVCLVGDPIRKSSVVPETDPSARNPAPFLVKIFYACPNDIDGLRLEMLCMAAHDAHNNKAGVDARAASEHLLADLAYKIKDTIDVFDRPKNLLFYVNPYGGARKAVNIFEADIKPLLELTGTNYSVVVTERADHAKEMVLNDQNDLRSFDGIVCVGGDGMFGEILNGILIRTQRAANVSYGSVDAQLVKPPIKLGIIPAGSTDAVVYATNGYKAPVNSALSILLGRTRNIDITAVHHRDEDRLIRYTASFLGYGFFGDTIMDSESNRWMGPRRYDWAGFKKFVKHQLYSGEIKLVIDTSDGSPKDYNPCGVDCSICKKAGKAARHSTGLNEDAAPACVSIRGRFLAINAATLSCRCGKSKIGMSPMAHVGNGCTDLILVSKCTRWSYLRYLIRLAFSSKSPFDFSFVDAYRVREFEFTPIIEPTKKKGYFYEKKVDYDFFDAFDEPDSTSKSESASTKSKAAMVESRKAKRRPGGSSLTSSVWNCDGEILNDTAIHVKVHCQLVTVFGTGCEVERFLGVRPTKVRFQ